MPRVRLADGRTFDVTPMDGEDLGAAVDRTLKAGASNVPLGMARAATSGMTMGWGDEGGVALAALAAKLQDHEKPYDQIYSEMKSRYDAQQNQFKDQHPYANAGAEIGGGIATASATGGGQLAAKIPALLRYPLVGGATGGIYGAGAADQGKRLEGAESGATVGAILGSAAGLADKVIISPLMTRLASAKTKAQQAIVDALARDSKTPAQVAARLEKLGPDATIADAAGENMLGLGRAAQSFPGQAKDAGAKLIRDRTLKQADRVLAPVEETFGSGRSFFPTLEELAQKRATEAAPLYRNAYAAPVELTDGLTALMTRPSMKLAMQRANKLAAEEGHQHLSQVQQLDYAKRSLDDLIDVAKRAGKNQEARALVDTKNALLAEVDAQVPAYNAARRAWSGPSQARDVMEDGRRFMLEPDEFTAAKLAKMSDSDKEFFRLGVAKGIRDKVESVRDTADVVKRLIGSEKQRRALRAVFPDNDSYRSFISTALAEGKKFESGRAMVGNSVTARLQAEQKDLLGTPDAAINLATGHPVTAALNAFKQLLTSRGMDEKTSNQLAKTLFEADPAKQKQILQDLFEPYARQQAATSIAPFAAGVAGGSLANQ